VAHIVTTVPYTVKHNVTILTDYYITNEKQRTYNVTLRRVRETIVDVEKQ
jgi:hypothetical protein